MKFTSSYFSVGMVTAVVATLTACGGGGGGGGSSGNVSSVTGVAATGQAIANGKVSLKCTVGDTVASPVSTNADGSFSIDVSKMTLPCVARVDFTNSSGTADKLHSLVRASGNVNITPVTDAVMANLRKTGKSVDSFAMDATELRSISDDRIKTATQTVKKQMESLGVDTTKLPDDVIGTKLVAANGSNKGDGHDSVLDDLKVKLHDRNKDLHDMEDDMHADHEPRGLSTSTGLPGDAAAGKVAYDANCASCHGAGLSDAKNSAKILEAIRENEGGMGKLKDIVTVAMADNIATYMANPLGGGTVPPVLKAQTITFSNPGNQTMGVTPAALSATASSALPVTITSSTPAVCTVAGTTLTLVAAGNCTLSANSGGTAVYSAAPTVSYSFTVAAAGGVVLTSQTISFASPGPQRVGTPATLSATASSGLPVIFASTTPTICTVNGSTLSLLAAGNCSISATQAGSSVFAAATATVTVAVTAPVPVVSATNGKALYASNGCGNCHNTPPSASNVLAGANSPSTIRNAITGNLGGMGRFSTLTDAQLADIAAYLATPNI